MQKLDPFQVEPLPKAFYHPTKEKELSKKEKKVCLSAPSIPPQQQQVSSPEDLKFLNDPNALKIQEIPTRENGSYADQSSSSQFNESWPSTERTASLNGTPGSESTLTSPVMSQQMREWLTGQDIAKPTTNKTTLGWYINRFRNAPPTSRQLRDRSSVTHQSQGNHGNFWWQSPPSGQSTPVLEQDTPPQKLTPSPLATNARANKKSVRKPPISTSTPTSLQSSDKTLDDLDKKAKELLEKSESSLDTISTEPFPLPLKKPTITKPKTFHTTSKPIITPTPPTANTTPSLTTPHNPWPEDDILYQWRLARKMEKAQEKASAIRPAGQPALQRSQTGYNYYRTGSLALPRSQTHMIGTGEPASTWSRHAQNDGINPLENGHENLNHIQMEDNKMNKPGTVETLHLSQGEQTSSNVNIERVLTIPRSLDQAHSINQNFKTSQPLVTMTTSEYTAPQYCHGNDASRASTSDTVTIATSTMGRTIVTPVVAPPCQHGSTSTHPPGVPPHMHLACDIIPCPCSDSSLRTNAYRKLEKGCVHHHKQPYKHSVNHGGDEIVDSEEEYEQKCSKRSDSTHENEASTTKTHLKSCKKTTDRIDTDLVLQPHQGDIIRTRDNTKDMSRETDAKFDELHKRTGEYWTNDNDWADSGKGKHQSVTHLSSDKTGKKDGVYVKMKEKSEKTGKASEIVGNVIGKVVSEHLFLGESSSSESDSNNKGITSTVNIPPQQQEKPASTDGVRTLLQESLLVESSEEEYSDDEILKMLRQRSRELKSQLREIDECLQNNE